MKLLLIVASLCSLSFNSIAAEGPTTRSVKVSEVNSAVFSNENGKTILKISYSTGGCDMNSNQPQVTLELVSKTDVTPKWAIDQNPNTIHEYQLVMNAVLSETRYSPMCTVAYDLDVSTDLTELFTKTAPSLGIDLAAKKAHYGVSFKAPQVSGSTFFSAFDQ